jgi:hypothetical protein
VKATTVADLHAWRCRLFFDVTAERLFAYGEIGGSALQANHVRGSPSLANSFALNSLQTAIAASRASRSKSESRPLSFDARMTPILDLEASPSLVLLGRNMAASPKRKYWDG